MKATTDKFGDLRKRIFFLLMALLVYRLGAHIPVPGIDPGAMASKRINMMRNHLSPGSCADSEKMVLWEKKDRVYLVTLNRPKALNALCNQLHEDLNEALNIARADPDCGCVVVTGTGRAFAGKITYRRDCAGSDAEITHKDRQVLCRRVLSSSLAYRTCYSRCRYYGDGGHVFVAERQR